MCKRRCLKCGQEFESEGSGNRICKDCAKVKWVWNVPVSPKKDE